MQPVVPRLTGGVRVSESQSLAELVPGVEGEIELTYHGTLMCEVRVKTSQNLSPDAVETLERFASVLGGSYEEVWLICPNREPRHFRFRNGVQLP